MGTNRNPLKRRYFRTDRAGWVCAPAAGLLAVNIMAQTALADPVATGHALAERYCARCHVVSPGNKFAGISSTPSFMTLVNALPDWEERFQTFYARRPHTVHVRVAGIAPQTDLPPNATPFTIQLSDVDAILAYVRTLQK